MRRLAVTSCALLAALPILSAQTPWRTPQPPCDLKAGHFRVSTAVTNMKVAAEKPVQRDRMLSQTVDVLTRAITGDGQDKNPAAWYWLGRYYVEMNDAAGADSAFTKTVALAPNCAGEVEGYRRTLWDGALGAAQQASDAGHVDSAAQLFRRALSLWPANPRPLFLIGQLYARHDRPDSAIAYFRKAAEAARTDTVYATARKEALETAARLELLRAQANPAVQRWSRTRFSRDSIERLAVADSIVLGRMTTSSQSRKTRGARLAPADQAAFTRDSTTRAQALEKDRAGRGALAERVAAESAAAQGFLTAAIQAHRDYLAAYPDAVEPVSALAMLYSASGRTEEAKTTLLGLYAAQDATVRLEAGKRAVRAGLPGAGAALLESGLNDSPYDRDALLELANAYRVQRDGDRMLAAAQRLLAVDPLNGTALRLVGTAWDLRGAADSARKYVGATDTLKVEVAVGTFMQDGDHYTLAGVAGNRQGSPSTPFTLTFEFLDAAGAVASTSKIAIPQIGPNGSFDFSIAAAGKALRGWRYRPS